MNANHGAETWMHLSCGYAVQRMLNVQRTDTVRNAEVLHGIVKEIGVFYDAEGSDVMLYCSRKKKW